MYKTKEFLKQNKKLIIILTGVTLLNAYYGFDAKFTIINLLWVLINVIKI